MSANKNYPTWNELLRKYEKDTSVKQLIFVQYQEGSKARIQLYSKTEEYPDIWTQMLSCSGFVGKNGLGKEIEGDMKTPIGDFGIVTAAGIKDNPGTKASYVKFDQHIYGADGPFYNKLLDTRIHGEDAVSKYNGDTFMDGSPQFNYGLFIDFNHDCIPGKGCYIFMHCTGPYDYTAGCVAVSEENMKQVLQLVDDNVRICIYPKE